MTAELVLVVAGLRVDAEEATAARGAALPRLPALEELLRHGAALPPPRAGWRAWLAASAGRADLAATPVAQVAAATLSADPVADVWLAQPVHLAPALDHLRLHRAGLLRLADEESRALARSFDLAFAGSGLALEPLFGGFLLRGLASAEATTQDPSRYAGADVGSAPARGPGAPRLRGLAAEIEMWLHAEPLNRARERRRALPVNALWLWGGGAATPGEWRLPLADLPVVHADDAWVAGLWHLSGGAADMLPRRYADLPSGAVPARRVVVLPATARDAADQPLPRLEADWFAPAAAALREGSLAAVTLVTETRALRVGPGGRWRFWRAARPWWTALAEAAR